MSYLIGLNLFLGFLYNGIVCVLALRKYYTRYGSTRDYAAGVIALIMASAYLLSYLFWFQSSCF